MLTLRWRFGPLSASDLGSHAVRAALKRAGVGPEQIEAVIVGQVSTGAGIYASSFGRSGPAPR